MVTVIDDLWATGKDIFDRACMLRWNIATLELRYLAYVYTLGGGRL